MNVKGGFQEFLSSSTIHGLQYVLQTKKIVKLFWTLVVIIGFIGAGVLISESFKAWAESPITTTIETVPISKLIYPKITVCPPEKTYTDLNYDLSVLGNKTITNNTRNQLTEYATELFQEHLQSIMLSDSMKLQEDNRYYNWYHGYTKVSLWSCPANKNCFIDEGARTYQIYSFAKKGSIHTQHFGEDMDGTKVDSSISYFILIADKVRKPMYSLHWKMEMVWIKESGTETLKQNGQLKQYETCFDYENKWIRSEKKTEYKRRVPKEDLMKLNLDKMPGFNITWYIKGEPPMKFANSDFNKAFKRQVLNIDI